MVQKNKLQHINLIEEFIYQEIEMYFSNSFKATKFWEILINYSECYVFGGFIVDFLNHSNEHRDIDIVISHLNQITKDLISNYGGKRNSFGGYKLVIDGLAIDIWAIKDTWAIKRMNYIDFDLIKLLPSTSFFNSTAIIYSIKEKKIIHHKKFLDYINHNKLDILFEDNPYPSLCILKSYEYFKNGIVFTKRLSNYIVNKYSTHFRNIEEMQKKHFGYLKYTKEELAVFIEEINSNMQYDVSSRSLNIHR